MPQTTREADWKEKAPVKVAGPTMAERRFRCHRRNLDGELAQVIRAEENVQQDKILTQQVAALDNHPIFKTFESNIPSVAKQPEF